MSSNALSRLLDTWLLSLEDKLAKDVLQLSKSARPFFNKDEAATIFNEVSAVQLLSEELIELRLLAIRA